MINAARLKQSIARILQRKDFLFVKKLARAFPDSEIYLVGGAVRDHLLGRREIKDYDLVVRKVTAAALQKELKKLGWVDLVGKFFGVLKYVPKGSDRQSAGHPERQRRARPELAEGIPTNSRDSSASSLRMTEAENFEPFDIALPRTEHAWGLGGYRDVDVQANPNLSIEDDLSRRDFTINAIAVKIHPKFEIIDPFQGIKDLKNKTIRTVGKPADRFKEDYSRLLRALRFTCQLNFKIEPQTWVSLKKSVSHLNDTRPKSDEWIVPRETIAKELLKTFYADAVKAFDLYHESGAFKQLMPELLKMKGCPQPQNYHTEGDVWTHTRLALTQLHSPAFKKLFVQGKNSPQTILAVLFHDMAKPVTLRTPEKHGVDRIRFDEHDTIGGQIAKKICERLKLSSPAGLGVDPDKIEWLVSHHLLLVHANVQDIRHTTLEKYFFNPNNPGQDLLKLLFADGSATIPQAGKPNLTDLKILLKRIAELEKIIKKRKKIVPSILNGDEIMKKFRLKPGPLIGELIAVLREQQLSKKIKTKKEAAEFLKKYLAKK